MGFNMISNMFHLYEYQDHNYIEIKNIRQSLWLASQCC